MPGPRWNTLTVQTGGTTTQQIRRSLSVSSRYGIYTWNTNRGTWTRATSTSRTIPAGTQVSFRTERAPRPADIADANLGEGTRTARLTLGWNLISPPQSITREDNKDFLYDPALTDCSNLRGVIAIAAYSARSRKWSLHLPCHPAAQTRLTTNDNPPYRPLNTIATGDTLYIYNRTSIALNIAWDSETQTYQPARRILR